MITVRRSAFASFSRTRTDYTRSLFKTATSTGPASEQNGQRSRNTGADPKSHPEVLDAFLSFAAAKERHVGGTFNPDRYNPDYWISEYADMSRSGQREIQSQLLYDYRTNVASYPRWQAWLRAHQPSTLVVWGDHDPSFHRSGCGGLQTRFTEGGNPPARRWAFRTG